MDGRHPHDAKAYTDDDTTRINAVVPPPDGDGKPSVLYTAYMYQPGSQPQDEMKQKPDLLLKDVQVKDRQGNVEQVVDGESVLRDEHHPESGRENTPVETPLVSRGDHRTLSHDLDFRRSTFILQPR